jgi:alpha-beta hydrolase superfamily lysophospholipase
MPILLLSGEEDPVGDFGRGVRHVASAMKKAGASNITCTLYPGARHDLLHEEACGAAALARNAISDWIKVHL